MVCSSSEVESFVQLVLQVSVDYLTKPLSVFKEMSRVLKPGGIAIMRSGAYIEAWILYWVSSDLDIF